MHTYIKFVLVSCMCSLAVSASIFDIIKNSGKHNRAVDGAVHQMQQSEIPEQEAENQYPSYEELEDLMNSIMKKHNHDREMKLVQFSWSDCGKAEDRVHISQLNIGPNPVRIPGNVSLTVHASIKQSIVSPVQVSLEVEKKVLIWVKIPCVDNIGSCTYADACAMNPYADKPCPSIFTQNGIPCKCPVKSGSYSLDAASLYVNPGGSIPSWLEDGDYRLTARFAQNGKELGCFNVALSLAK